MKRFSLKAERLTRSIRPGVLCTLSYRWVYSSRYQINNFCQTEARPFASHLTDLLDSSGGSLCRVIEPLLF